MNESRSLAGRAPKVVYALTSRPLNLHCSFVCSLPGLCGGSAPQPDYFSVTLKRGRGSSRFWRLTSRGEFL